SKVKKEAKHLRKSIREKKVVLSIDRLDYTKGFIKRLEAVDYLFEKYPEYRGKISFIMVSVPSRIKIPQYREMKIQLDETIGRINGKYSSVEWTPIYYMYRSLPFKTLLALYSLADVALVTPLRDGMNLVSKEYVASRTGADGVLVLSEMAGVSEELGEALIVNPNNKEEIAEALHTALTMSSEEQNERMRAMQNRLKRNDIFKWFNDFIEKLKQAHLLQEKMATRLITEKIEEEIFQTYTRARRRLFLLDYDGTLVPFRERPRDAKPDKELLRILKELAAHPENTVVILSGRDRKILERWFGDMDVALVAEHGAWIRMRKEDWKTIIPLENAWKEKIRPIFERYVDRTPGAFIEEKEYSLAWHYRNSDPEFASLRAKELRGTCRELVANLHLAIMEGNKVLEIKNIEINKGKAALLFLSQTSADFVFAVGDDTTDEDIFDVVGSNYSIKIGPDPSRANYYLENFLDVREFLHKMAEIKGNQNVV
ncbi:MAG TPA: bifunctional alpha,alpha-trehalose-phosphate synthase (UDP-forming)/trehalose-phosphatase, partial [bacterium]|nr:bifunctional alpha,alpha-trehalose-phosphate synthase (UDP-forming)/trehalose-phosphatase [bacterium]